MSKLNIWAILLVMLTCLACQKESTSEDIDEGVEVGVEVPDKILDEEVNPFLTRTSLALVGSKMQFSWNESDLIGVFNVVAEATENTPFNYKSGTNTHGETSSTARFNCGDYEFSKDYYWVAYSPYLLVSSGKVTDYYNIKLIYDGQTQLCNATPTGLHPDADGSGYDEASEALAASHLGAYDYMISAPAQPDDNNYTSFKFEHIGATVRFYMMFPQGSFGTGQNALIKSMSIISKDEVFVKEANLQINKQNSTITTPYYSVKKKAGSEELDLVHTKEMQLKFGENGNGVMLPDGGYLIAYMEFYPVTVAAESCYLLIKGELNGEERYFRSTPLTAKTMKAGKLYQWTTGEIYLPIELTATIAPWEDVHGGTITTGE